MSAVMNAVLLSDGGHGTVPFVIGCERRAVYGYPLVMASRSTLMAAIDWTLQMQDMHAEPHHLLADQHLSDEQWKLFQALWLYAHGDELAFDGLFVPKGTAEQLRGYLGIDDCAAFRIATQQPSAVSDALKRVDETQRRILKQVLALPEEQMHGAVTYFDTAMQTNFTKLNCDMSDQLQHADDLVYPVIVFNEFTHNRLTHTQWNYRGHIASCLPPYIRKWVNDHRVRWWVFGDNIAVSRDELDAVTVQATALASIAGVPVYTEKLLVPNAFQAAGLQHVVQGLARDMLYTPVMNANKGFDIDKRVAKGENAWNALVQQYQDAALSIIVVVELLHEVIRIGRRLRVCIMISDLYESIEENCDDFVSDPNATSLENLQTCFECLCKLQTAMRTDW